MASNKKFSDTEIAKMLLDERKRSILDLSKNHPITVSQIAEKLGEKPSRLYYHVNKLEEAGLMELVETRNQGNLIEKYYQSKPGLYQYELSSSLLQDSDSMMKEIMKLLEPGLKLLAEDMKNGNDVKKKSQVNLAINFSEMTGREWAQSHDRMIHAMRDRENGKELNQDSSNEECQLTEEELEAKSKYAFLILSYRLDDAKNM